jgi:hypothetical protein
VDGMDDGPGVGAGTGDELGMDMDPCCSDTAWTACLSITRSDGRLDPPDSMTSSSGEAWISGVEVDEVA